MISVVVPVFNRAHLVARSVGSICAQSYPNLDIVVADDCSTDNIEEAIAALGDPRVRLVRRAVNGGAAAARNTGIIAAKAAWIAFHDSDDICAFDRIEQQVRAMMTLPAEAIGLYGARLFYTEASEGNYSEMVTHVRPFAHEKPLSGPLFERTLQNNILNLPTLFVKKSALEAAGMFDARLRNNEDWDLSLRLTQLGPIGFVASPMIYTPTEPASERAVQRISRSDLYSARSFVRILGKLRRAGHHGPALARHYTTTARFLIKINRPRLARPYLRAALAITPAKPRLWAHFALSYAPGLHAALRRRGGL